MPLFRFEARNRRDKLIKGRLQADTEADARVMLAEKGYTVLAMVEETGVAARVDRLVARFRRPSLTDMAVTTRQLAVMLAAGLPITRALQVLTQQPLPNQLWEAWSQTSLDVTRGTELSRALNRHSHVFSMFYIGMVKAGETSGQLHNNLAYVADYLEREARTEAKVKAALTYPAFVFVCCCLVVMLIVQGVLPQFLNTMFKESSLTLPWSTQILIAVTQFFANKEHMAGLVAFGVLASVLLSRYLRTPVGQYRFQLLCLHLPVVRDLLGKVLAVRFCRTLATMIQSGVPLLRGLELADVVLGSYVLHEHIEYARNLVKEGSRLSVGLRSISFFPTLVATFVQLGEDTGNLPDLLQRTAEIFEEELDGELQAFTALLEPLLMAVMGCIVGFILIAIFLPLYQILGTF